MTDTPIPATDLANQLLGIVPANLTIGLLDTPHGKRLILTIRTPSSTTTVFLERDEARDWGTKILAAADQMTGLTIVHGNVPAGLLAAPGV